MTARDSSNRSLRTLVTVIVGATAGIVAEHGQEASVQAETGVRHGG